jgi:predicted ATPase/class 3 adenylate cyclase
MSDIETWLDRHGLGKYLVACLEHEVDLESVPELTEDDLREIGLPVGPRRKFLKAARGLVEGDSQSANPAEDVSSGSASRSPGTMSGEAERRQLTVLFADLVGSTELAERLDPEELRDLIRAYQDACAGAVSRYEGYVARYVGDGLLVYFGFPRAHEDDAERAVRAARAILDAVARLPMDGDRSAEVRVGIATGLVVVGDIVGEGASQESTVVGETPNLAARLQGLAGPNAIVIGASTHELLGDQFEFGDLGPQALKGISGPVQAWTVRGERTLESRFEARHPGELGTFVGRDQEVELLVERWRRARQGEGQVVLLSGEAGIGKSRITEMLRVRLRDEDHARIQYQCSPHHVNSPLYPAIQQLSFAAGFAHDDSAEARVGKLETLLNQSPVELEDFALLAALLSVPTGSRYPSLDMSPQEQKQKTLLALVNVFESLSRRGPVLFIFEDTHWIDPTTREQIDMIVDRAAKLPVLVLITHRPEFKSHWASYAHCTVLTLNRLGRSACVRLIEDLTEGRALPAEVTAQIIDKTDGIPLFVEELTKTVLESDLIAARDGAYVLTGPLPPLAIPSTLQDSLMARLDRLEGIKEVSQIGAAIGREFSHRLLALVAQLEEDHLREALERLIASEIVFRRGAPPDAVYVFKHALIQDTAYDTLLRSRRQIIHKQIAEAIKAEFPDHAANEPEVLAHHYSQAGLHDEAAPQWLVAGTRAVARSANLEAIAHLRAGLQAVAGMEPGSGASSLELDMQIGLGSALIAARGYSSTETERAYLRGLELLDRLGDDPRQFAVLHGLCMLYWNRATLSRNLEVAEDMLARAERQNEVLPKLVAHRVLAVALNPMGRFDAAREHAEQAVSFYDRDLHGDSAHQFGHDMGVGALWHLSIALLFKGELDSSKRYANQASELARSLNNATTTAYDALWFSFTALVRRDWEAARRTTERMIEESLSRSMALWVVFGRHLQGSALAAQGRSEEALEELRRSRLAAEQLTHSMLTTMTMRYEAQALADLGRSEEAAERLRETVEVMASTGERWLESEVYRALGALHVSDDAAAEASFARALDIARDQGARLLELRAAQDIARLWSTKGRRGEARDILSGVASRFTEGLDSPDLREARALLAELS